MNDSIITLALTRHDEMMRQAERRRLIARVRRAARQATRTERQARGPVLRLRPTATGR